MQQADFQKVVATFAREQGLAIGKDVLSWLWHHALWLKEHDFLVGKLSLEQIASDLICDSLILAPFIKEKAKLLDLGTGGGIPGLVLAIVTGCHAILLDSQKRKIRALQAFASGFDNLEFVWARGEVYTAEHRQSVDFVTMKGFSFSQGVEIGLPALKVGGTLFSLQSEAFEGAPFKAAIQLLGGSKSVEKVVSLPSGKKTRLIGIRKKARTPEKFPRPFSRIKKKPLPSLPADILRMC